MSKVISVEGLGKKYLISHETREKHTTLRQAITTRVRGMLGAATDRQTSAPVAYEEFWALRDVSFDIHHGERLGIIGRNGAGKSTLLKILSRVTAPTTGRARIRGRLSSLLEVGTGFHPDLTGRENIFLNGALLGMSRAEIASKFDEIVAFSEVEQFIDTPVKRYSSGMYVRLAFSVSAHLEPEILVVDEVLSVGDGEFQTKCMKKMESVGREGRTVLFVSHSLATLARLCPRCILMENGKISLDGSTDAVIRHYLASSAPHEGTYTQPHDPAKDMNLRRVSLALGQEETVGHVRYDEPVTIRLEYEVNRSVTDCTVWAALQTSEGIMVLTTADHDMDLAKLESRDPGYYVAELSVPGKWLNVGEYCVVAGVVKNRPLVVYDRVETVTFKVAEIGTPGSLTSEGVRRGVLQPFLPWKTSRSVETAPA